MRYAATILLFFATVFCLHGQVKNLTPTKRDTVYLQSYPVRDTLIIRPVYQTQEDNSGFDLKIWIPSFTALFVLLVTNLVTLYKIQHDAKESLRKDIILTKLKIERERLEKFYDPIFTTLISNAATFKAYGPDSFPKDSGLLETEASMVWRQIVENVIIPNNKKICDIIHQYSHLMEPKDSINHYLEFTIHAESYGHFIKFPNTLHKSFKYPANFMGQVETIRNDVLSDLRATEIKLIA